MTRIDFKNRKDAFISAMRVVMMATAIGAVMVSCGGGGNQQSAGKKTDVEAAQELVAKAEDKSVTADNWQAFVKKEFGVDIAVPDGWKFNQVNALNFSETIITILIRFEKAGENAAKVSETARSLFDRTKALSSDGIFLIDVDVNGGGMKKGETFATFDDRFKPSMMYDGVSDIETYWYYKTSDGIKLVDVSAEKGRMTVKVEFNKVMKL